MNWIVLFSFSGQEASEVTKHVSGRDLGVYSNRASESPFNFNVPVTYLRPSAINARLEAVVTPTLVTLHGYDRILPEEVIANPALRIYNVHPGDVVKYPELVGLHPQKKAIEQGFKSTGVVIHKVTSDLDMGPIARRHTTPIYEGEGVDSLVHRLREISIQLWLSLLQEYEII